MKPAQAAAMSKPNPFVTPSAAWTRSAVAGKAWSGVLVARMIASTSAGFGAGVRNAARAAAVPMKAAVSCVVGDMALADASALADPVIRRIHRAREFVVGDARARADRRRRLQGSSEWPLSSYGAVARRGPVPLSFSDALSFAVSAIKPAIRVKSSRMWSLNRCTTISIATSTA